MKCLISIHHSVSGVYVFLIVGFRKDVMLERSEASQGGEFQIHFLKYLAFRGNRHIQS
jgi:hypothetical protein